MSESFLTQMLPTKGLPTKKRSGHAGSLPPNDILHSIFEYRNGDLIRKKCYFKSKIGVCSGSVDSRGYLVSSVGHKTYLNHRIIYQMVYGHCPDVLDHVDGDRLNNKLENLRPVTRGGNAHNASIRSDNTSGVKGVCWHSRDRKWVAVLNFNNKRHSLGYHTTIEAAEAAVRAKRIEFHAEYANHGIATRRGATC